MSEEKYNLDHILNILGEEDGGHFGAITPPIYQTSNFAFDKVDHLTEAIKDEMGRHLYTRGNNPSTAIIRKKIAALEKCEDCIVFASGIAAISAGIISQVKTGDHIISVENPYSWISKLLKNFLSRFGVESTFVDGRDIRDFKGALQDNTRLIVLESPNSMTFEIQDLGRVAQFAQDNGLTTLIDNSYSSPLYQNPREMGIDLIAHSGSKYLNGHSDVVFGALCGDVALLKPVFESEFMNLGAILSPFEASLVLRGLRTLPIRMERTTNSTMTVFHFLKGRPWIKKVYYPLDPESDQYELAKSQMKAAPGLISIEVNCDHPVKLKAFAEGLRYFRMAVSWGGHESLIFPMISVHQAFEMRPPHLPVNFFRLYIGLEDPASLIKDLDQASKYLQGQA